MCLSFLYAFHLAESQIAFNDFKDGRGDARAQKKTRMDAKRRNMQRDNTRSSKGRSVRQAPKSLLITGLLRTKTFYPNFGREYKDYVYLRVHEQSVAGQIIHSAVAFVAS